MQKFEQKGFRDTPKHPFAGSWKGWNYANCTRNQFTFRSVDIHGNISYPSKVYQIELVNDSGAVYLVTDIYDFPTRKRTMKKTVRKFLNIAPANDQHDWHNKAPDSVSSYVNYTPVLGDLFESSKRYKFRLTSKKSGKKLDINVKVKLTKRNTEEEKTS